MLDLVGTALAEVAPTQGWVGVLLTALLALALLLIPDGATPRVIAVGSWTPSAFNAGRFRFTFTSTQASSATVYAGSYVALLGNGLGGLWVVDRVLTLFNQSGSVFGRPITFNASQPVTVTIDVTGPTGTVTIEGALTGNGTYTFTNTGVYFATGETLGIGVYNAGVYNFPGTIGAIDDAAPPITATSSATLGAIGGTAAAAVIAGASSTHTLGAVTGAAAGTVAITATTAGQLGPVGGTAAAAVAVAGSSTSSLGAVTGSASAAVLVAATSAAVLDPITGAASASTAADPVVTASSSATLGAITGTAAATAAISASSIAALGPVTGNAVASTQPIVTASSSAVLGAIGGTAAATVSAAVVRDLRPGVVVSLVDHRKAARLVDNRLACHLPPRGTMSLPAALHPYTVAGDTIPIVFGFNESVDGAAFTFAHQLWGTITALGVGQTVEIPITEARAAAAAGTYAYVLLINDGVEGEEQTVAWGNHHHRARSYAP